MPRPLLVTACAAVVLAGCGAAPDPVSAFDDGEGTRIWEAYDRTGSERSTVPVRGAVSSFRLQMDCVGEGEVAVRLAGVGVGSVACRSGDGEGPGAVEMNPPEPLATDELDLTVTAPEGARWSVAVDVLP